MNPQNFLRVAGQLRRVELGGLTVRAFLESAVFKFGGLVIAGAIGLMVIGVVQMRGARVDVYPEFTPPSVQIQTEALGLSAAEVEQLITLRLEQDLLNGDAMAGEHPLVVAAGPVGDRPRVRAGDRHLCGTADGAGAADPGARPAERRHATDHDRAAVLDQPSRDGRAVVEARSP